MLVCPSCRSEFRDGFSHCHSCEQDLVPADALEVAFELDESEELIVLQAGPLGYIREQSDYLKANLIPNIFKIRDESDCQSCAPTFVLIVPSSVLAKARSVLEKKWKADGSVAGTDKSADGPISIDYNSEQITCPACGFEFKLEENCPDCGLFIGVPEVDEPNQKS